MAKRGATAEKIASSKAFRAPRIASVVVGTDFSDAADKAVHRAEEIASTQRARLHLVHATLPLPGPLARLAGIDPRAIQRDLEAVAAVARSSGVAHVKTHHVSGIGAGGLAEVCRAVSAAVVVVGTRGRSLPDGLIGSTAERLAASSEVPVLLVRRRSRRAYRDVVVAVDTNTDLSRVVAASRRVAPGAEVTLLHAYFAPFETTLALHGARMGDILRHRSDARRAAREKLERRVEEAALAVAKLELRHGDARRVLARHVRPDELLVLVRSRAALRHVMLGSVVRSVLASGKSDVLLV